VNALRSVLLAVLFPACLQAEITQGLGIPAGALRTDNYAAAGYGFYTPAEGALINRLGYWDANGDGLATPHTVMVGQFNGSNAYNEMIRVTIPAGTGAYLEGGYRWVEIPPTHLPNIGQGLDFYVVVASHGTDAWTNPTNVPAVMNPKIGTAVSAAEVPDSGPMVAGNIQAIGGTPAGWIGANLGYQAGTMETDTRLKIMPLGDSITAGYTDNPVFGMPFEFGYRATLATLLSQAGVPFRFVGTSSEPFPTTYGDPTRGGTAYPPNEIRDPQIAQAGHRGYGGIDILGVTLKVAQWIAEDDPDMILLKIGTNGMGPDSPGKLNTLVSTIFTAKPEVQLVVAQIIPNATYIPDIVSYNAYIRNTLVPSFQAQGRKITTVDQYANFLTDPADLTSIDPAKFSNAINHPTNAAYALMAATWLPAIAPVAMSQAIIPPGTEPGTLFATLSRPGGSPEITPEFSLVTGTGDADNAKFAIKGNQLIAASHHFKHDPAGKTYSIRIRVTGPGSAEQELRPRLGANTGTPVLIEAFSSSTQTEYAADVRNNDLLHGLEGLHLNYRTISGPAGPQINDGLHGADGATASIAWASDGNLASSTYELGVGNGAGYDVNRITSIAAWSGAGFMNQKYKVSVRYAGAGLFTPAPDCTVNFQPFTDIGTSNAGATKVVITRPGGAVFRGIAAIRFTQLDTISNNIGGVTLREIDVEGNATAVAGPKLFDIQAPAFPGADATIHWQSRLGASYRIEGSPNLEDWQALESNLPSEGLVSDFIDTTVEPSDMRRYYRISEDAP
jgi:lysophospholipase L1-like esterase